MIPLRDDIPSKTFPVVTLSLIAANIMVFFFQISLGQDDGLLFIYKTAVIPYEITNFVDLKPYGLVPPPLTLLSSVFIHGGVLHLAGNMLYLWIFGDNIEDRLGHVRFIVFYLGAGIVASLVHVYTGPQSLQPVVGASGAIAGVLGAYMLIYPKARIQTLLYFFIIVHFVRVPAIFFLGLWFLLQLLSSTAGGPVAWSAHIGGFITGMAVVLLFGLRKPAKRKPDGR